MGLRMTNKRSRLIDTLVNNIKLKDVISPVAFRCATIIKSSYVPMQERDQFAAMSVKKESLSLFLSFSVPLFLNILLDYTNRPRLRINPRIIAYPPFATN